MSSICTCVGGRPRRNLRGGRAKPARPLTQEELDEIEASELSNCLSARCFHTSECLCCTWSH
eukprot:14875268-Alexandrium_andersonii.AAC.1